MNLCKRLHVTYIGLVQKIGAIFTFYIQLEKRK